jgi:hypothetical protein
MNKFIHIFLLLIIIIFILLIFAPLIDHLFYVDHKLEKISELKILGFIIIHIILLGILIYLFHYYIVKKYIKYFKLNETYVKIIDLVLSLILVGLQRNLVYKLRYLSSKHPIRSKLIK